MYDDVIDSKYFPRYAFKSFSRNKLLYILNIVWNAKRWNKIIVGHINLAFPIYLVRLFNKNVEIYLIAHGIEVWDTQKGFKKWLLNKAIKVIAVSNFTKNNILENNPIHPDKIEVLHNCLDAYYQPIGRFKKPNYLKKRYQINEEKVILTITRINAQEGYKGYDIVIEALGELHKTGCTDFKYLLCGKYDDVEFKRITTIIHQNNLSNNIIITGFLEEDEMVDHYQLSDIFIMPSKGEGFGIVFIEAAAMGSNVIAGNIDGSAEALKYGAWGDLVNPNSKEEIKNAILKGIIKPKQIDSSKQIFQEMSFENYRTNLLKSLSI